MNTITQRTPLSATTRAWTPPWRLLLALAVGLLVGDSSTFAGTKTWTGGAFPNADWSTAGNWSPSGAPGNDDDLVFPSGNTSKAPINDIPGATLSRIASVTISDSGYDVTSSSGSTLTISGGIINSSSSGVANWRINLSLSADQSFETTTASASLALFGTLNLNSHLLTFKGSGNMDQTALISGTGGITKSGAGSLSLANLNDNTYTGQTTVDGGVLFIIFESDLGANPASPNTGQLTLDGGTLQFGLTETIDDSNRGITLGASGGTFNVNDTKTLTVTKVIMGAGNLSKTGLGTMKLSTVANTFTGKTTVSAGTLMIDSEDRLGSNPGSATADQLTIASGATLNAFGSFTIDDSNRGITLGSGTATVSVDTGMTLAVANVIAGSGGALTKTGTGILTLSGINTYSGATTVSAGKLIGVTGASCANSAVTISTTTSTNGVTVSDNTKQWTCAGLTYSLAGVLDFNFGSIPLSTTVAPIQVNGNMSFTATPSVTIEAGNIPAGIGDYPLVTWTGSKSGTEPTTATLPPHISGHLSVSGKTLFLNITGNAQPLRWYNVGGGAWTSTDMWADSSPDPQLATYSETTIPGDAVQFEDTMSDGAGPFPITLNSTVNPASVAANSYKDFSISGSGSISGATTLMKSGSGKLTLATANGYTSGTTLSAGTLVINNNTALGSGTLTISSGTIDSTVGVALSGNNLQNWNGDFTFTGTSTLNLGSGEVTLNGTRNLTVSASTLTVGGSIFGSSYGLTKLGSGTLTLAGASTYSGATTVSVGKLVVSGSTAVGSAVTVASGATLAGGGTVSGSVAVDGTIAPADSAATGTLNTGAESWNSGGTYNVEVKTAGGTAGLPLGWDLLNISGSLVVNATSGSKFTIKVIGIGLGSKPSGFDNAKDWSWRIATASGGVDQFDASKFTIDKSGFTGTLGSGQFIVSQSGNNVYLEFVHLTATPVTIGRAWGTYLRIPVSTVTAAVSGGSAPYTLSSVTSRNGDSVQISGTDILFAPSGNATRILDYTVHDSTPPTAYTGSSTITVTVTNAVSAVNVISSTGQGITITFAGVPGFLYVVERSASADFSTTITIVQTMTAPASGLWTYIEASPPNPSFYRSRQNN